MNEFDLSNQFTDNGFTINNASKFTKELKAMNMEPYDLLNKLLTLQKQANSNVTIVDFSKNMLEKINRFNEIINADENYKLSSKDTIKKINDDINYIDQHFTAIKNYLRAEENMLQHKQSVLDVKKKIYELGKNKTISDSERTSQTLKLQGELKACESAYNEALTFCNEQKAIYNKQIGNTKVSDFKNELLTGINTLEIDCKDLAISEETKKSLTELIQSMRNETAYYALDNIKSQNEFEALCARYSLSYDDKKKENSPVKTDMPKASEKDKNDEPKKESTLEATPTKETEESTLSEEEKKTPKKDIVPGEDFPAKDDEIETLEPIAEPKIKVVARRACKWLNKHKKQILIAIGISLLIVATIVALQYLIPAITTMLHTGQVANLSTAMISNGQLWGSAIASEQVALHGANTALASAIETMTGTKAAFDVGTGIWTFGGTELTKFAATMGANAAAAAQTATAISNSVLGLGVTGLGLTGLGAILPKQKSSEYYNLRSEIKSIKHNLKNMSHDEVSEKVAQVITKINSSNLNADDKMRLINRANRIIDKSLNLEETEEEIETLDGGMSR